ncbi:ADP-ribosylglycohydrolase family protein [Flavobacteriaceae bacterium]|nr:ADP-ribosylglycohydrolase family protein [Flavobacteriaceae bacterium]MDA9977466.1 ADP-ribosylglycohydrolase family protein [Flavobacteriaceae bacterium]MDB4024624.1 ADP-ribosylglycohydrolase family protein [Flavobacteriaceae bacterium]MDB9827688.1 ADP-ribosylglycohydrolase family protein [Flavobacteriaceae bacterium]MDC0106374.1 ADP-ribosylglycohydrolase family protein [Flavobacteriaceae bacterium]
MSCVDFKINRTDFFEIDKEEYSNKLEGFWLGQSIANWTGLITEMDKIGNIGEIKTGNFYTRENWSKKDEPNIWSPNNKYETIDFVLRNKNEIWGSDDDTDIEYMYQELLFQSNETVLSPKDIRDGWLKHMKIEEENFLWVSNQKAFDLMNQGFLPPETSNPKFNEHFDMIDAQLTTEIFGLLSPTNYKYALKMSNLPVRTTSRGDAALISEFYIIIHSLASTINPNMPLYKELVRISDLASDVLDKNSYSFKMYNYVKKKFESGIKWEQTRDSIYNRYQVNQMDGYDITSRELYCNGCFASGINFASSLVSYFYGKGDFKETIKIASLSGWDSDNPASTWGGLLGFIHGKTKIENIFNKPLSNKYNIHRTRQNFENNGLDNFKNMSKKGLSIIDNVVLKTGGFIDLDENSWYIPKQKSLN